MPEDQDERASGIYQVTTFSKEWVLEQNDSLRTELYNKMFYVYILVALGCR